MLLNIAVNFFSSSNKVLVVSRRPEAAFFPGQSPANSSHHLSAQSGSWAVSYGCSPESGGRRDILGSGIGAPAVSPPPQPTEALLLLSEPQCLYLVNGSDGNYFTDGEKASRSYRRQK